MNLLPTSNSGQTKPQKRGSPLLLQIFSLREKENGPELGLEKSNFDGKRFGVGGMQIQVYLQGRKKALEATKISNARLIRKAVNSLALPAHHLHEEWEKSLERKIRTLMGTWRCQALKRVHA